MLSLLDTELENRPTVVKVLQHRFFKAPMDQLKLAGEATQKQAIWDEKKEADLCQLHLQKCADDAQIAHLHQVLFKSQARSVFCLPNSNAEQNSIL